ncbi:MAG: hypothetical protein DMD26_15355 [Gemmatimonadetes bacterium]|nr:MAG: hypothetical protein DMD26_15355 [Gemmatimonadota bacterium]
MRRCLTLIAGAVLAGCHRSARTDTAELALAAAASESLTVALADSIAPAQGFIANQAGGAVEALSACSDHVSAAGWQSVGSSLVEMELPPEFVSAGQTSQSASWNGPSGSIRAASYRGDSPHVGIYGTITSECDIFISGAPAHVDLVSGYGRSVHVIVRPQDAPAMIIEGQAKTIAGQAQLLHAIRYARVSAAWGRKY